MFTKLKELLKNWKEDRSRKRICQNMTKRYDERYQLENLLEEYIIQRINAGQVQRRKELTEKQAIIKETKIMADFFRNHK